MGSEVLTTELSEADRYQLEKRVELVFQSAPQVNMPEATPTLVPKTATFEERTEKLLDDCQNMRSQCDQLLVQIGKMAKDLTFPVPADALEVRTALASLGLNPNQMSYQDYVDLLKMQMALGRSMGTQVSYGNQV